MRNSAVFSLYRCSARWGPVSRLFDAECDSTASSVWLGRKNPA
ncbi:hypothetical protein LAUMK35_05429 [Mycobacterium pseudokansasii]|nr:hypothetical protein LAUMK35_05429 [Mycobacterium pseudokansasii]VBA34918.1 hypothetical protein LAUMK21_05389 [Mycobacterium pseudokansasii]